MNKELIKTYKAEFDHWLNGGKLQVKFVNDPWEEAPKGIFSYSTVNFVLVIDDEYIEFRRALAEGKTIQYYVDGFAGWQDVKSLNQSCMNPASFRIKPEETKFKVGDWVRDGENIYQFIEPSSIHSYESSLQRCELWEPKEEEYFWYKNDLVKFDEIKTNYGTLLESVRGCSYHTAEENFEDYCEPFIGQLPTYLRK